ncbi:MAG: glycosyltransferase [Anaerolineae bacterium]
MKNIKVKLAAVLVVAATFWYISWLLTHLNWYALWLAIPFAVSSVFMAVIVLLNAVNNWDHTIPSEKTVAPGNEPEVLVIIPTLNEPPQMVYLTARSVVDQQYPRPKIHVVLSDDGHRDIIKAMAERLGNEFPDAHFSYHEPPLQGSAERHGDAKAGNLNSVLENIDSIAPKVGYIETRDADDLVSDPSFLRQVVGQLEADPHVAFVQTIKEAHTSFGDPFGNQEAIFYRRTMLGRNSANAVFPCGSGLVWRRTALEDICGFPFWNLVEDLQSGLEALKKGWHGLFLPIVGAMGQTAPEDLPNQIKQRGTWAIDTMRLSLYVRKKGLNLRQRLQFLELGMFYPLSFAFLIYAATAIIALTFGIYPTTVSPLAYALHFWPYAATIELLALAVAEGLPLETLWRGRATWFGLAPIYAKAVILAVWYGPHRKPVYRVTRKNNMYGYFFAEIAFQLFTFVALIGAIIYHLLTRSLLINMDLGSLFWAIFFILLLWGTVRNAWHGMTHEDLACNLRAVIERDGNVCIPVNTQREQEIAQGGSGTD